MADIFVSYSRQDRERVAPLVAALEAEGWAVWWDPEITPGQEFDSRIAAELDGASAVIVVWTPNSIESRWVKGEAREAADRGILVPVRFENARLPLDVRAIHTTEFDGWQGDRGQAAFQDLVRALNGLLKKSAVAPPDSPPAGATDGGRQVSICVLPFANMSGDPEQEYFSDGISEDVITDLSKVSALAVTARNTAFAYKGRHVDVAQIARQLKVSHVLEGSVRKAGSRVRISAQLIDGATGNHVWAERYDRDLNDIFALQDEISQAIVGALKLRLLPEEKKAIEKRGTSNAEAYKLYLMARQYLVTGNERHRPLIIRLCERAVEIDPGYARAWALLAIGISNYRMLSMANVANGLDAANRALALDPNLAEAHAARGRILADQSQYDAAMAEHSIALRLDPDSYDVNCAAARCYGGMRRYADAIRHFENAADLVAADFWAVGMTIQFHRAKGDPGSAARAARRTLERVESVIAAEPDNAVAMGWGVTALVALGEKERAREWAERALLLAAPDEVNLRYNLACSMVHLGETGAAIRLLEQVLATSTMEALVWVETDPDLDAIRDDPRFQAMLGKAKARVAGS